MKRTRCGACGYDGLEMFLDLGSSPIADAYTETPDQLVERYPLQLAVCTGCWLVQLLDVVDHEVLFGTGYSFYSSASAPLSEYNAVYAADLLARHGALAKQLTVEIGCNDGDMLRHFYAASCPVVGIDPATGPLAVAEERGLQVAGVAFGSDVADKIRDAHGPAGLVIANHVLAHVEDVSDVLDGISRLLAPNGVAYIEVQYLPDLLVNNAFDLVYHEHRNFFSLTSLEQAAKRWGLYVVDTQLTDRQGGSLRVAVTKQRPTWVTPHHEMLRSAEEWLLDVSAYRGMQARANRIRSRLLQLVYETPDGMVVGYGAPAKATTLLNFCGIGSDQMRVVIDTTTAKQGRFIPGTGVLIASPAEVDLRHADAILLLAWNYARTIMHQHPEFTGDWIVPIPAPVKL